MANETCNKECMPHIGADGFWYVGAEFTGVRAIGKDGITPNIGADGYWYIWDKNMGVKAVGEQGVKGERGEKGDQGVTGSQGPQGVKGDKGDAGATGSQGQQGPKGDKGDTGAAGPQGLQGAKGDKGDAGTAGPQGQQGPRGEKGETGERGPAGPVNIMDNLITQMKGYALDASQGMILAEAIKQANSNLSDYVEYKSVPNRGYYIKFSFGVVIQWMKVDSRTQKIDRPYGSLYQGVYKWEYPLPFEDSEKIDTVICSHFQYDTGASWGTVVETSPTTATLRGIDAYQRNGGASCTINAMVIGRWK